MPLSPCLINFLHLWGFLILHHPQAMSHHPDLSSVRILLGQLKQNSLYPWCFLLVISIHWLPPPSFSPLPLLLPSPPPTPWLLILSWKWKCESLSPVWLCDPMEYSLPGSFVHGILQTGILEWVAIPFSRGIFLIQGSNRVSCTAGNSFLSESPGQHQFQLDHALFWYGPKLSLTLRFQCSSPLRFNEVFLSHFNKSHQKKFFSSNKEKEDTAGV